MECNEACKRGCRYLLWTLGFSWQTGFSTILMCIAVPYLRIILHVSYFHIAMFFLGESLFRIAGYCLVRVHEFTECCPSTPCFHMVLVFIWLSIAVCSSFVFSIISCFIDVNDNNLRPTIVGVATLLYGLMRFSMEVSLCLSRPFQKIWSESEAQIWEKLSFIGPIFGFIEVLLIFGIPTNLLDNVHIIVGLVSGVMFIQMAFIFLAWCLLKKTDSLCESEVKFPYTATCCGDLAYELGEIWKCLNVKAGALSFIYLVFRMISHSLLIFAFDWYARHESDSSESSINFYDINGASMGLAQMLLVPTVFSLIFPFVKVFLSRCIHKFIFSWLTSLLGIGTFLSLFLCFIYFQKSLFYFAFLSIGITIFLLPLKFDLLEHFAPIFGSWSLLPSDYVNPHAYRRLFELLDLIGTLLGSVVSSIIIEFSGYPLFLHVATFSMGFVFILLCSLPLFKSCKSYDRIFPVAYYSAKRVSFGAESADGCCEYAAKPYLHETGVEPRVIFKRIATKFF